MIWIQDPGSRILQPGSRILALRGSKVAAGLREEILSLDSASIEDVVAAVGHWGVVLPYGRRSIDPVKLCSLGTFQGGPPWTHRVYNCSCH